MGDEEFWRVERHRGRAVEHAVLVDSGVALMPPPPGVCPLLDQESGSCTVYPVRPMICALWGAVRGMECPHGCRPEGGYLSPLDAMVLLHMAMNGGEESEAQVRARFRLLGSEELTDELVRRIERARISPARNVATPPPAPGGPGLQLLHAREQLLR